MISEIAWENIHWLKQTFFASLDKIGGSMIAVDSFRPYLRRSWVRRLKASTVRHKFLKEIANWAEEIGTTKLTKTFRMERWKESEILQVARGGEEYSQLINFLSRSHYNLYCLSTNRKTIEELALGAYAYCSRTERHTETSDKTALADFRRLLRLSNTFLLAEWVHDMIERAVSNDDEAFFRVLSNSVKTNILADPSPAAVQWLLVVLLWHLGGKDIPRRGEFLQLLKDEGILPEATDDLSFTTTLSKLHLTTQ